MPQETHKRAGWIAALTAITILLFIVFLAIPGYIAGYYCHARHDISSQINISLTWEETIPHIPNTSMQILLTPSHIAAKICPPLLDVYIRQFNAASSFAEHQRASRSP